MELILFVLLNYGVSNIIVHSSIFLGFREFFEKVSPNFFGVLFNCMICTPFWTGAFFTVLFKFVGSDLIPYDLGESVFLVILSVFLNSCLSSGSVFVLHTIQERFER